MSSRSAEVDLRNGIKQQLHKLSNKLRCGGDVSRQQVYKSELVSKLSNLAQVAVHTDTANEQHYEVPTAFFKLILDSRMKYSCGLWDEGNLSDLDKAQEKMLALICERASIKDGHVVMDLGCGWGSLGLYILERYPRCRVVCLSNSNTQRRYIEGEARQRGYAGRLRVITADASTYDNPEHRNHFDRIVSIEMFEHMRNYKALFRRVSSWLTPSGLLFTQILCHHNSPYLFSTNINSDTEWMAKNFFTGGTMPSADLFLYFQNDVIIENLWVTNGCHYTKTLDAWLRRMNERISDVERLFEDVYGKSAVDERVFNWRMFFIMCSEVFQYNDGNEWVVAHHLFSKRHQVLSRL